MGSLVAARQRQDNPVGVGNPRQGVGTSWEHPLVEEGSPAVAGSLAGVAGSLHSPRALQITQETHRVNKHIEDKNGKVTVCHGGSAEAAAVSPG